MQYIGTIGISAMLTEIRANPGVPFTIEWWRAANEHNLRHNKAGTVKRIAKAAQGAPKRQNPTRTPSTRANREPSTVNREPSKADFRDTAQFPITDTETPGTFYTPLISHIKSYNGYKVIH